MFINSSLFVDPCQNDTAMRGINSEAKPNNLSVSKNVSFEKILAEKTEKNYPMTFHSKLEDRYPMLNIITHTADIEIPRSVLYRKDFPVNEFFKSNGNIGAAKKWRPKGSAPSGLEPEIQDMIESIGRGNLSVVIPPAVQEKMDSTPEYADKIVEKVAEWIHMDIAVNEHMAPGSTKDASWCIMLTEDGEIGNTIGVTMGNGEIKYAPTSRLYSSQSTPHLNAKNQSYEYQWKHILAEKPDLEFDYSYSMSILASAFSSKSK